MRQLRPRHYNDLAESSQRTYGYWFTGYVHAATAANQPKYGPDKEWLDDWLASEAQISPQRAQHRMNAIGYAFWKEGLEDPTLDLAIREQIYNLKTESRCQRLEILGIVPKKARRYVGYYVNNRYADSTLRSFNQRGAAWQLWAQRHGINPDSATGTEVAQYVQTFSTTSYYNVTNVIRALQYYFETRDLPDVTKSNEIDLLLEVLRRSSRGGVKPLFLNSVRRIAEGFSSDRLDKRDHLVLLLLFFGGLMPTMQSELTIEDCSPKPDGLSINSRGRTVWIDAYPDDDRIDIVRVYATYVKSIEWSSGPLFRSLGLRGEYLPKMSPGALANCVNNATERAGIHVASAARSLHYGFVIQSIAVFGVVVTAAHLGFKDPRSLNRYSPKARAESEQISGKRKIWPRRGHASKRGKSTSTRIE